MPAAGVTWVGVLPTYRRRRVLSTLMQAQLDAVHGAGTEPIAVLWASEPQIYGRFGYGMASRYYSRAVPRGTDALLPDDWPGGELRSAYLAYERRFHAVARDWFRAQVEG